MWLGDTAALSEQARQAARKCVLVFHGPKKAEMSLRPCQGWRRAAPADRLNHANSAVSVPTALGLNHDFWPFGQHHQRHNTKGGWHLGSVGLGDGWVRGEAENADRHKTPHRGVAVFSIVFFLAKAHARTKKQCARQCGDHGAITLSGPAARALSDATKCQIGAPAASAVASNTSSAEHLSHR